MRTIETFDLGKTRQLHSFDSEWIAMLEAICRQLEISDVMYNQAKERYDSITNYLREPGTSMAMSFPDLYLQGSTKLGLTVKPLGINEFDVDVIAQLVITGQVTQEAFVQILFDRLQQRGCYTLVRMNRCVRVQYANEFHIDITPAIPDQDLGPLNIKVTDKDVGRWKESNPREYATWFADTAKKMPIVIYASRLLMEKYASAEPLPPPAFSRPLLNRIIQLLKRHRDIMFNGQKDAPISAIITTLATHSYNKHVTSEFRSFSQFVETVVRDIPNFIIRAEGDESVPNPKNPFENFADKWRTKPERKKAFYRWHATAVAHFEGMLKTMDRGKQNFFESLSSAYGEDIVKKASTIVAEARKAQSESRILGVSKGTGLIAPVVTSAALNKPVLPVKSHTFFGS